MAGNTIAESGKPAAFTVLRMKGLREHIYRSRKVYVANTGTASYRAPANQQGSRAAEGKKQRSSSWYISVIGVSAERVDSHHFFPRHLYLECQRGVWWARPTEELTVTCRNLIFQKYLKEQKHPVGTVWELIWSKCHSSSALALPNI